MKTEILSTHTQALFTAAVKVAADRLRAGEVVALPTETVYGLTANALDAAAVAKIFQIKGRPAHNPIIVHVVGRDMARSCVAEWPELAETFSKSFWPGPVTLVLPRAREIPDIVTAGGETIGVRWPSHPFMQAVIRACGFPLAAPSANLSNQISPTNAEHVRSQLDGKISLIVDGGQAQVGIESTVVDLTVAPPKILRPGMIHLESIAAVAGSVQSTAAGQTPAALRSPGLLEKHYSPKAKLIALDWRNETDLRAQLAAFHFQLPTIHILAHTCIPVGLAAENVSVIPHDAAAFARALYAELHRCDAAGAKLIVVESLPTAPEWAGITDRLKRAAA